ncbi:hypothetical protein Tco_0145533 [Tanacetum coccineum]
MPIMIYRRCSLFKPVQPHTEDRYEPLEEDTDYVSEDESEIGEQRMINDIDGDKPFAPKPQPKDGVSFVADDEERDISGALLCQLLPKELNPGTNLKETNMVVEMVDMMKKAPLGIVENILVKINKFLFPSDFVIIDKLGEPRIEEDRVKFDMDGGICHSKIPVENFYMANSVHEEEYFNPLEIKDDELEDNHEDVDHERQSVGGNCMIFVDFLKVRYGNKNIDDTTRERRYYEWVVQNSEFSDNGISHEATMYDNPCSVRNEVLNQWVLDSFDVKADYGKTHNDPYSRRFNEYRKEKCKKFYEGTSYPWHDEGFKEQERWESGIEKIDYEPPFVDTETIEIKRHSFKGGRSFICITKQLDDAFPLGRVNGSRFIGMIKKEMDEEGGTIRKTRIILEVNTARLKKLVLLAEVSTASRVSTASILVMDSFDVEIDYGKTRDDPYSRRFDEYNECTHGMMKDSRKKSFIKIETFKIKRYSFKRGKSFMCITKQLDDALPLGRANRSRFIGIIRKEINTDGSTKEETNEMEFKVNSTDFHVVKRRNTTFDQETCDLDVEIKQMKELKASYNVTSPQELRRNQVNEVVLVTPNEINFPDEDEGEGGAVHRHQPMKNEKVTKIATLEACLVTERITMDDNLVVKESTVDSTSLEQLDECNYSMEKIDMVSSCFDSKEQHMQLQISPVQALEASLVIMKSSGTESENNSSESTFSRSENENRSSDKESSSSEGNDANADISPSYNSDTVTETSKSGTDRSDSSNVASKRRQCSNGETGPWL